MPAEPPRWFVLGARVRGVATTAGLLGMFLGLGGAFLLPNDAVPDAVILVLAIGGAALLAVGTALTLWPGAPEIAPRRVAPPVRGRWSALNSPGSRVPSHGTHGHGQTFAIDLVYEPADGSRPAFGSDGGFRPSTDFPGFGQPLYAPADGTVVAARDRARDHRSRSTWPAIGYLMLEGFVRELPGSRHVIGNHVILKLDDGAFAVLAHLQRGSAAVRRGQRVGRGDLLARCGNSGNSSEPHVHFQLMESRRPFLAAGLPFGFDGMADLPADEEVITVDA